MTRSDRARRPAVANWPCVVPPAASRVACVAALCAALSGCVYLPVTVEVYDPDCRIVTRQMALQPVQLGAFHHCANEGCVMLLAAAGATAAASAVVSGSIVVAGNVAYWFEKKGRCHPDTGTAVVPPAGEPAGAPDPSRRPTPTTTP